MFFYCGMCERDLGGFNDDKFNLSWQGGRVVKIVIVILGCLNKNRGFVSDSFVLVYSYIFLYNN